MRVWMVELRLLLRARPTVVAVLLLTLLSAAAVTGGMAEVSRQRAAIARIASAQAEDVGAIAKWVNEKKDPGSAAYYTFHATWDAPSPLAFAALGMRDVAPFIQRVRALGLEAQIYDGDNFNPELALPGRFDWSFVLVFLMPLFVIVLFHDLSSGEREAGRARTLAAVPGGIAPVLRRRTALRLGAILLAAVLPFAVGAALSGAQPLPVSAAIGLAAAYALFWVGAAALVSRLRWSSTANAATLAAAWLVLVLVLVVPTFANVAIARAVPVAQGAEIALAQREQVNRAWDIPREETMRRFYAGHPRLADSAPLPTGFHYKWYFAFHQVGDEGVAGRVAAYRAGLERRGAAADALGLVLPSVGVQAALTRLARTDLEAQLAFQDRVRAYHRRLRDFYYGYLFYDRPFGTADFARAPRFGGIADD